MLTPYEVQTATPLEEFVASEMNSSIGVMNVLPSYTVPREAGYYFTINKASKDVMFGSEDLQVAPGGDPLDVSWNLDKITVEMKEYAVKKTIPRAVKDNADGLDPEQYSARVCMARLGLQVARDWAAFMKTSGNYTGGTKTAAAWETNKSDLQSQIADGKKAVGEKVGRSPDTLIVGGTAYDKLVEWLNIDGSVPYRENVQNKLGVDRIFKAGASDGSAYVYDGEAVLQVTSASEGGNLHAHSAFLVSALNNFNVVVDYDSENRPFVAIRVAYAIAALSKDSGYRFAGVS